MITQIIVVQSLVAINSSQWNGTGYGMDLGIDGQKEWLFSNALHT